MSFSQLVCKSTISQKNKLFNVIFPAGLQMDNLKKNKKKKGNFELRTEKRTRYHSKNSQNNKRSEHLCKKFLQHVMTRLWYSLYQKQ